MRTLKKLSLLLAVCLLFTTCVAVMAAQADEGKTLSVWAIQSAAVSDYATNAQTEWVEAQTGVHIDWTDVPASGWATSFQNHVLSGEQVDVYLYHFDTSEVDILSQMGILIPLENLIDDYAPNLKARLDADPALKNLITAPDGHIYTLWQETYDVNTIKQKLWVNAAWLESYEAATGNGMPETTDEFKQMLIYFRDNDMNGNGDATDEIPYMGVNGVDGTYNIAGAFVPACSSSGYGSFVNDAGEMDFAYNTEAYRQALAFMHELYEAGLWNSETFTINYGDRFKYTSGKPEDVRIGVVSAVNAANVVLLSGEKGSLDYSSYIALPSLTGSEGVRTMVAISDTTIELKNGITSFCDDPVTAIKWLDFGYGEECRKFSIYGGLEGENWHYAEGKNIDGTGMIVVRDGDLPDNFTWSGQGIAYEITEDDYQHMDATQLGTNDGLATYVAEKAYAPYVVLNQWPPIVWAGENTEAAEEYSELIRLLNNRVTEYYTGVILGTKDLEDDWDAYAAELDSIGVNRFIELVRLYIATGEEQK